METMGDRIRKARLAAGWTQRELAEHAGLSSMTISLLERDKSRNPRLLTVQAVASALGCSVPYLLYGDIGRWAMFLGRWPVLEPAKKAGAVSEKVDVPIEEDGE